MAESIPSDYSQTTQARGVKQEAGDESEQTVNFNVDVQQSSRVDEPATVGQQNEIFEIGVLPFLRKQNGTYIYIYHTREPWLLALDALVMPFEERSGYQRDQFLKYLLSGPSGETAVSQIEQQLSPWIPAVRQPLWIPLPADVLESRQAFVPGNGRNQVAHLQTAESGLTPIKQIIFAAAATPDDDPSLPLPRIRLAITAVIQLAAQQGIRSLAIPIFEEEDNETAVTMLQQIDIVLRTLNPNPLQSIVLLTTDDTMIPYLQEIGTEQASLPPINDLAEGNDTLNIAIEAHSLAEMLMLRDVEPPLCVGVLGGWGSGKSFFMHLMKQKMNQIRSFRLEEKETWVRDELNNSKSDLLEFVGHIYQIEFNAWTYAKSNLWASLMQTIFSELNRQMTLEKRLEALNVERFNPLQGGEIWQILNKMPPDTRDALLTTELGREAMTLESFRTDANVQETADSLWSALQTLRNAEQQALDDIEQERNSLKIQINKTKTEIAEMVSVEIEVQTKAAIWEPLKAQLVYLWSHAEEKIEPLQTPFPLDENELQLTESEKQDAASTSFALQFLQPGTMDTIRWLWADRNEKSKLIALGLFWMLGILTPIILTAIDPFTGVTEWLTAFIALPSLLPLRQLLREAKQLQNGLNNLREEYQTIVKNRVDLLEESRAAREQTLQVQAGIPDQERELAQLETRAEWHRQRIGLTANYVSIADFVNARIESKSYESQLGLMQQAHSDLEELTNGLAIHKYDIHREKKQELFKRGPARVVLFIDDLDRCPPDRVVEVFEAAQLLLKTRLFVVVLALDVRYVSRALEKVYKGILSRQGDPSGMDYIEKIIQIPYRIRPIDEDALPGYLEQQMSRVEVAETAVSAPPLSNHNQMQNDLGAGSGDDETDGETAVYTSVTQAVEFSDDEQAIISCCCEQVELTPRSIKRFINVFKLIKLVWNRGYRGQQPNEVSSAVGLLLTLSARYPELMRGVFDYLWQAFSHSPDTHLDNLLSLYPLPATEPFLQHDYEQWQQIIARFSTLEVLKNDPGLRIGGISLHQLGRHNFNLIRSLCFVGDVGRDASEMQ